MLTVVFVLKTGAEFEFDHAVALANQVDRHLTRAHCCALLTDALMPDEVEPLPFTTIPLLLNAPGFWSMVEMFRIPGPTLYLDLDCRILGPLDPLADYIEAMPETTVMLLEAWNKNYVGGAWCTGLTAWTGDKSELFKRFSEQVKAGNFDPSRKRPDGILRAGAFNVAGVRYSSDETWTPTQIQSMHLDIVGLRETMPGFLQSYRYDLAEGSKKPTGSIVMFHERPRPWEVGW